MFSWNNVTVNGFFILFILSYLMNYIIFNYISIKNTKITWHTNCLLMCKKCDMTKLRDDDYFNSDKKSSKNVKSRH